MSLISRRVLGMRVDATSPRSAKAWMAFLTVCEPHPKLLAISGGESPRELVRSLWHRRLTKASLEPSAVSNCSFSVSESERTKIGGLMVSTRASNTTPILDMH
jgi:hypothetical protein